MSKFIFNTLLYALLGYCVYHDSTLAVVIIAVFCVLNSVAVIGAPKSVAVIYLKALKREGIARQYVEYANFPYAVALGVLAGTMGYYITSSLIGLYAVLDLWVFRQAYHVWKANGCERVS